jgi:hypothetical protein
MSAKPRSQMKRFGSSKSRNCPTRSCRGLPGFRKLPARKARQQRRACPASECIGEAPGQDNRWRAHGISNSIVRFGRQAIR